MSLVIETTYKVGEEVLLARPRRTRCRVAECAEWAAPETLPRSPNRESRSRLWETLVVTVARYLATSASYPVMTTVREFSAFVSPSLTFSSAASSGSAAALAPTSKSIAPSPRKRRSPRLAPRIAPA